MSARREQREPSADRQVTHHGSSLGERSAQARASPRRASSRWQYRKPCPCRRTSRRRLEGVAVPPPSSRAIVAALPPRTIARQQWIVTRPPPSSTARNPRIGPASSSFRRTSSLGASGVPRSNHSSKSSVKASSVSRIAASPSEAKRSTISPDERFRVWVRSRSRSMALCSSDDRDGSGSGSGGRKGPAAPPGRMQVHLVTDEGQWSSTWCRTCIAKDRGVERTRSGGWIEERLALEPRPIAEPRRSGAWPGPSSRRRGRRPRCDAGGLEEAPGSPAPARNRRRGPVSSGGRSASTRTSEGNLPPGRSWTRGLLEPGGLTVEGRR